MVDIEEVYVRDLFNKYKGRPEYKGLYSIGKKIHQDDGEINNEGFAIDEGNLRILMAKIDALFMNETRPTHRKTLRSNNSRQTKLPKLNTAKSKSHNLR